MSLKFNAKWCHWPEGSIPVTDVSEIVRFVLSSGRVNRKINLSGIQKKKKKELNIIIISKKKRGKN